MAVGGVALSNPRDERGKHATDPLTWNLRELFDLQRFEFEKNGLLIVQSEDDSLAIVLSKVALVMFGQLRQRLRRATIKWQDGSA